MQTLEKQLVEADAGLAKKASELIDAKSSLEALTAKLEAVQKEADRVQYLQSDLECSKAQVASFEDLVKTHGTSQRFLLCLTLE